MLKATKRLLDSIWTVSYNVLNENEIEIIGYNRDDPEGYKNECNLPQCTVIEDDKRNFIGLMVREKFKFNYFDWVNSKNADHIYKVVNPKHITSYK